MHALSSATQQRTGTRIAPVGPVIAFALFLLASAAVVTVSVIRDATADDAAPRQAVVERPSYDHFRFVEENTVLPGSEQWVAPQAGDQRSAHEEKPALDFTREWRRFAEANDIAPDDLARMREPWFLNPNLSRGGLLQA